MISETQTGANQFNQIAFQLPQGNASLAWAKKKEVIEVFEAHGEIEQVWGRSP